MSAERGGVGIGGTEGTRDDEAGGRWRVEVDQVACLRSGMCLAVAPGHFEYGPGGPARAVAEEIDPDEDVVDAAMSCMAEAIRITGVGTRRSVYPPA